MNIIGMKFEEYYKALNKEQREAVDTIEGPVMVIAGPGTGKTTILTLRIANILKKTDTPPSAILAITYTNAGVVAMKKKLRQIIGDRANDVRIHTFHSFASSIISEYREHFAELKNFSQMTDVDSDLILKKILENERFLKLRPEGDPERNITELIKFIGEYKRANQTPEELKKYFLEKIKEVKKDPDSISSRGKTKGLMKADAKKKIEKIEKSILATEVFREYEEEKKKKKFLDFDDLISILIRALKEDKLLLQLLQESYLYFLIDEHQDTNDSQNFIIKTLADFYDSPNVFIVGDEKQAIFRFQGASVSNFLQLKKLWKDVKVIALKSNYRSHQNILDASFSMIENNYSEGEHEDLRVSLSSGIPLEKREIDIFYAKNGVVSDIFLAEKIKEILKEDENSEVAIILRKNKEVQSLVRFLELEGLDVSSSFSLNIFDHPIGVLFFSLVSYIRNPLDFESLAKTVVAGLWGLSFEERTEALKLIRGEKIEEILKIKDGLQKINKNISELHPINFIINLVNESGLLELILKNTINVSVWRGIVNFCRSILERTKKEDVFSLFDELIAFKDLHGRKTLILDYGDSGSKVKVLTAHKSKGLEFDYVFIPGASEETWLKGDTKSSFVLPGEFEVTEDDKLKDSRRLFYVAFTRAKKHLSIIVPEEDFDGKELTPLRFIKELKRETLKERRLDENDYSYKHKNVSVEDINHKNIISFSKNTILEQGLSVTALNHFISCPSKFLIKSILKMPEGPNINSERGNALHKALENVWNFKTCEYKVSDISKIISQSTEEYVSSSNLIPLDKKNLQRVLKEIIPLISKSLISHFNEEGNYKVEDFLVSEFKTNFDGEELSVSLKGRLDLILEKENEVFVFDYKSKKRMSENEIRGNTKDSDGNYFRQLVFYEILIGSQNRFKGKYIKNHLVFLTPDEKGECKIISLPIEKTDIEDLKKHINLLIESVWTGKILTEFCEDKSCYFCALKKVIKNGY